jgi:hypothetical protein
MWRYPRRVLFSIGRATTILAICLSLGLHWIALQSLAWTTMLVAQARHVPLSEAVAKTFDGAHPCSLCHAVNAGKKSEKKSDLQSTTPKIDMICSARPVRLLRPFVLFEYATTNSNLSDSGDSPPVPPPRARLS